MESTNFGLTGGVSASTVEKAFLLLEFLASAQKPASLNDVTSVARMPKPTVCRLLRLLQNLGYVSRPTGSRDYLVGPRAARLSASDPFTELKAAARPLLRRLHEELNETVNLGVLSGTQVLYLDFVETTRPLRFIVTPGESDPYHCTALGRAIAARLSAERFGQLAAATALRRPASCAIRTKAQLCEVIAGARQNGFAEEIEEATEGVSCLAIDLGFLGFPEAALSVAVPVQRLDPRRREVVLAVLKALPHS